MYVTFLSGISLRLVPVLVMLVICKYELDQDKEHYIYNFIMVNQA